MEFDPPVQRLGVHLPANEPTDLGGRYVLMSDHLYYFGDKPQPLPDELLPIVKQGQGHQSRGNAASVDAFVTWIEHLGVKPNTALGNPQLDFFVNDSAASACADSRKDADLEDERLDTPVADV